MDNSSIENLKIVRASNKSMLEYFNGLYVQKLEMVQNLKTEQFELKVKIDELVKTLDVYSFKNSAGHNVFSPFSTGTTIQQEKALQIEGQLRDLLDVQISIDAKITKLEKEIDDLKHQIEILEANKQSAIDIEVKKVENIKNNEINDIQTENLKLEASYKEKINKIQSENKQNIANLISEKDIL